MDRAEDREVGWIQIALRLEGTLPTGVVSAPGAVAREFTGWVGLMSAVDALVAPDGGAIGEETER